jgi:hypothetical protein
MDAGLVENKSEIVTAVACFDFPDSGWVRQLPAKKEYRSRGYGSSSLEHFTYETSNSP